VGHEEESAVIRRSAASHLSNEAPQAVFQTKRMEVKQQTERKTDDPQVGLQLNVMNRRQCRDCRDFRDNGFLHQDIGPEPKRQSFHHRTSPGYRLRAA
jgi:hypothetical protein